MHLVLILQSRASGPQLAWRRSKSRRVSLARTKSRCGASQLLRPQLAVPQVQTCLHLSKLEKDRAAIMQPRARFCAAQLPPQVSAPAHSSGRTQVMRRADVFDCARACAPRYRGGCRCHACGGSRCAPGSLRAAILSVQAAGVASLALDQLCGSP